MELAAKPMGQGVAQQDHNRSGQRAPRLRANRGITLADETGQNISKKQRGGGFCNPAHVDCLQAGIAD